jgi:hypothetical protein
MISKGRKLRPSPAMVVAFVALFVALVGTAFSVGSRVPGKNGVKSSDIAPKAVKSSDIAPKAVKTSDLGTAAVTGQKVAANTLSGAHINYGSHVVTQANAEGADGATASCPPGEIATGGGADSADAADTGALLTSTPQPISGPATGWKVFYQFQANASEIFAFAVCMPD